MTFLSRAAMLLAARRKSPVAGPPPANTRRFAMLRSRAHCAALALVLMLALASQRVVWCQTLPATTPEIFQQNSEHVVKIEVVETGSAAKASIGTGFFATAAGHIVTNYHVISKLIHSPDRYRIDVTDGPRRGAGERVFEV